MTANLPAGLARGGMVPVPARQMEFGFYGNVVPELRGRWITAARMAAATGWSVRTIYSLVVAGVLIHESLPKTGRRAPRSGRVRRDVRILCESALLFIVQQASHPVTELVAMAHEATAKFTPEMRASLIARLVADQRS